MIFACDYSLFKKGALAAACLLFVFMRVFSFQRAPAAKTIPDEPELLRILRSSYPDVDFDCAYSEADSDWIINVSIEGRSAALFWADGKLLPQDALAQKDLYFPLMYKYNFELQDPADFTEEDIKQIRDFSSPENRTRGKGTPPFFYDVVYDCASRVSLERHITNISFLGKTTNAHERLKKPLASVEIAIYAAAKTDAEVKEFVDTLLSADSYSWRNISDSGNRSFHSLGLAVDVLPRGWGSKNVYWAWRRDIDPENWMLLPLERRWMPPRKVIEIFEQNGFIWGGKWTIWDNMHFEYRPELILFSR